MKTERQIDAKERRKDVTRRVKMEGQRMRWEDESDRVACKLERAKK